MTRIWSVRVALLFISPTHSWQRWHRDSPTPVRQKGRDPAQTLYNLLTDDVRLPVMPDVMSRLQMERKQHRHLGSRG